MTALPRNVAMCQEDITTVLSLAGQGPLCPSELQAQADPFHIAVTRRKRLGATEYEISTGEAGIAHAAP